LCGRCASSPLLRAAGAIDAFYRSVGDFNVWSTVWRIVGLAGRPRQADKAALKWQRAPKQVMRAVQLRKPAVGI
jgi:hypothetical protein